MKHLIGLLVGLVVGAACAAGIVYLNPLTLQQHEPAAGESLPLAYSLSGAGSLEATLGVAPGMPVLPGQRPEFWERGIRGTVLESFVVNDDTGAPAAVATKLVVPSTASDGVRSGILTDDHWLVTMPGRGSLVASGRSNIWPMLRDSVVRVDWLNRTWEGPKRYSMLDGGAALLTGASGEFTGLRGTLAEVLALDDYPRTGLDGLTGEIALTLAEAE